MGKVGMARRQHITAYALKGLQCLCKDAQQQTQHQNVELKCPASKVRTQMSGILSKPLSYQNINGSEGG
jgi:hypothetical protein